MLVTIGAMATGTGIRIRTLDAARHHWADTARRIGNELRTARHVLNLTLAQVAAAIGVSQSEVSRRELGRSRRLTGEKLAVHAAAVGLKLSVKLWPVGGGVRDAAQLRYVAAFAARVGRRWRITIEAAVPIAGDLRAVDILLTNDAVRIAVEVITRLIDLQAQIRAAQAKARDIGATRLVLVVAATHANRAELLAARPALVGAFELDTRRQLSDLAAGRDPGRDGIILLSA